MSRVGDENLKRKMKAGGNSVDREGEGDGAIQDEIWRKARKSR